MQNILESLGDYVTSGTTVSDTWALNGAGAAVAPAEGTELLAITLDNNSGGRGTMPSGWVALSAGEAVGGTSTVATPWRKTAGASEPTAVAYTATGGGHHGIKMFSFPAGTTFLAAGNTTAPTATNNLALPDLSPARSWFGVTGMVTNGGATSLDPTDGFTNKFLQSRAAVAVKASGSAGVAAADWVLTGTTSRIMTGTIVVAVEAEPPPPPPPPPSGINTYLIKADGTLLPAVWRLA